MAALVADVGGTHTRVARAVEGALCDAETLPSAGVDDLAATLAGYVARTGPVEAACLAVAGPVFGGQVHLTNLGWTLDARALEAALGVPVRLINDIHAQALAMPAIGAEHRVLLAPTTAATRPPGHCRAVIGPGTGLGEAILAPDDRGAWVVVAGEGGHKRFAPRDAAARRVADFLAGRHGDHVSVERVVSGPGLVAVYDALRGDAPRLPAMAAEDPAAVITREALGGGDAVCRQALDVFVDALADEAAGLALQCNAGVVDLTGGIPGRILPALRARLREGFERKGRYSEWLRTVPVSVVLHPDPGLLGARLAAEALAR
ncbi:MAG: glucokinase [bacterium]